MASKSFVGEWKATRPYTGAGRIEFESGDAFEGIVRKGRPLQGKGAWVEEGISTFNGEIRDGWPYSGSGGLLMRGRRYTGVWKGGVGDGSIQSKHASSDYEFSGEFRPMLRDGDPEQLPWKGSGSFESDG
eukprot:SAG11_NODE_19270_length_470_cov_1.504043_1_plen_129_part_10